MLKIENNKLKRKGMAYDTSKGGVKLDVEIKLEQEANVA